MTSDPTRTSRGQRALLTLFPPDAGDRVDEMTDALTLNPDTSALRQAPSILWAAAVAWRRYLRRPAALHQAIWLGSVLWLSLLIVIGPNLRASFAIRGEFVPDGFADDPRLHVAAALLLTTAALCVTSRWKWVALAIAPVVAAAGLVTAATMNRVGQFRFAAALIYELRWIGLTFVVALVLRPQQPWRVASPLGLATMLIAFAVQGDAYQGFGSRNYGAGLRSLIWTLPSLPASNWVDAAMLVVGAASVVLVFKFPALIALATVPAVGVALPHLRAEPAAAASQLLALATLAGAIALWNYRRPRISVITIDEPGRRRRQIRVQITVSFGGPPRTDPPA